MGLLNKEEPQTVTMHGVPWPNRSLFAACFVFAVVALAGTADTSGKQRWAIVAIDEPSELAGELLTVQLADSEDIELVERSTIQAVLAEQQLASGLAAPQQSLRLGSLLAADALILINQPEKIVPRQLRIRLVEVATGAQLLDTFVPAADFESGITATGEALQHARRTLSVPVAERRFVSMAGVRSEESGESLNVPGRLLRAFLEADLSRIEKVVVLEREQVHRLVAETDLTGAEQKLRSSTWLIEAGLRRDSAGRGYIVSGNLHPLGDHTGKSFQVAIPEDLLVARKQLATVVAEQLDTVLADDVLPDRFGEAELFARKRDWYDHSWRKHDAQEMAQAAAALAPTKDNVKKLLDLYYSEARGNDSRLRTHDALLAAKRYNEARLIWLQRTPGDRDVFPVVLRESMYAFQPLIRFGTREESEEDAKLRDEVNQLAVQLFDLSWRDLKDDPETQRKVWNNAMFHAFHIARSWDDYLAFLEKLRVLYIEDLGGSPDEFERSLFQHYQNRPTRSSSKWEATGAEQRGKFEARMLAAARLFANDKDVTLRLHALKLRMGLPGDEGAEAARGIFQTLFPRPPDAPPIGNINQQLNNSLMYAVYRRLEQVGEGAGLYERILRTAEENQDAELLAYWSVTMHLAFVHFPKDKKREIAPRIFTVLEAADATGYAATQIRGLRYNITKEMTERGLVARPILAMQDAPAPWKEFTARSIPIEKLPDRFQLYEVLFDKRPEAAAGDEQLVLVWARRFGKLSVERVSIRGGQPRKIGPDISGSPVAFHGIKVAIGDDGTVYVASETPGIMAVNDMGAKVIGPDEGAPGGRVQALAWLDGKLYVTYESVFSVFDPESQRFELLASTTAVQPDSPLDGGVGYFIFEMLADPDNHCLWFNVQANSADMSRFGLWRYEPKVDQFTHVFHRVPKASLSESLLLVMNKDDASWSEADSKTGTIKPLMGYDLKKGSPPTIPGKFTMLRFGQNLIDVYGRLFTPDGQVHELKIESPWPYLQHVESGFLTHFDYRENALWIVTPQEPATLAAPPPAPE